jgi:hypothetical protein
VVQAGAFLILPGQTRLGVAVLVLSKRANLGYTMRLAEEEHHEKPKYRYCLHFIHSGYRLHFAWKCVR